jgi:enoyl-CoA hydratase
MDLGRYSNDFNALTFEEVDDRILGIVLDAPGKLNAVSRSMHRQLVFVWRAVDEDPDVDVVVVRGADRNFSSGGDLDMVEEIAASAETRAQILVEAQRLVYEIIDCSKPIVSAMRGVAVGVGLAIGLLADISVATPSARLIDGHTRLGVAAGDHACIVWPLLCGIAKAKYHLLLGEPMDGREAERIGVVSLCVEDEELEDRAFSIARKLRDGSPTAISWTKYSLNQWLRQAGPIFDTSLGLEFLGFAGADVHEGIAAIREKRPARFRRDLGPASG